MVQSVNNGSAKLQLRIKFRSEDLNGFVERYGSDVSPGGIFIRSRQPLDVGTRVLFSFSSLNGDPLLVGEGTIVWVRQPEGEAAGGNPGMGIRFDTLDVESRARLAVILEGKTAREKSGKPPMRGPTPIPDGPFSGLALSSSPPDATAKVRLTADGRIVPDMPVPRPVVPMPSAPSHAVPMPSASGPAPSMPYASSLSNPQTSRPVVPAARPASEMLRRATPALGTETSPQPFGPSKTLGSSFNPVLGPGGDVVRSQQSAPNRTATPSFGTDVTRGAGGGAFSSTVAFGQEPTRQRNVEEELRAEPTRGGMTPGPDLLRRATPPPMPATPPPSVFSRPTSIPGMPLSELRSGASRTGPVVGRPTGSRPAFAETPKPAIDPGSEAAWAADKTEVVEDFPRFDEAEEKTTTVRGQVLAASEGFGSMPLTRPEIPNRLTPPAPIAAASARPKNGGITKSFPVLPVLSDLFDGEALPGPGDSASLLTSVGSDAVNEFGSVESTARGRRVTPAPGASMVARKVETTEFRVEKRRPFLWIVLGGVALVGGVFAVVNYVESNRRAPVETSVAPENAALVPAEAAPIAAAPVAAPPSEPAAPEPVAAEPVAAEPAPTAPEPVAAAPKSPVASPVVAKAAPVKPAPVAKPAPAAARPLVAPAPAPSPAPAASPSTAAIIDDDEEAVYWLRVRSTPPGADVFVDGELEGQTPFQRRIFDSSRPYAVSVRKEGFETNDRMISASDPWAKVKDEFLLTISVKLRKAAAAPAEPAVPEGEAAPSP